jgi:hypothetical protein
MPRKPSLTPRMPVKTKAGNARDAYDLLGIVVADVMMVPKIEPLLKQAGVMSKIWEFLGASDQEEARKLLAMRGRVTKAQANAIPFEAYCVAAGIPTKRALAVITGEVFSQTDQAALLMASAAHPDVVAATVEAAKDPRGTKERGMLLQHSGFVPVPQTSVVKVFGGKNVIGPGSQQTNQTLAVLPPIETVVREISDRFNQRLLPAAPREPDVPVFETECADDSEEEDE